MKDSRRHAHSGTPRCAFTYEATRVWSGYFWAILKEAAVAFADALAVCRDASSEHLVDETLLAMAAVAAARGQLGRAARIAGAAERHKTIAQAHGEVTIRHRLRKLLQAPRSSYGAARWSRACQEGASFTVYEAIDLALEHELVTSAESAPRPT